MQLFTSVFILVSLSADTSPEDIYIWALMVRVSELSVTGGLSSLNAAFFAM